MYLDYYSHDGLGSVATLTHYEDDENHQPIRYRYSAFGAIVQGDFTNNPYGYTSRRFDHENGFYHYHFRKYDPVTGNWLTPDPIGIGGGINLYRFVSNNPVNYVDWLGLAIEAGTGLSDGSPDHDGDGVPNEVDSNPYSYDPPGDGDEGGGFWSDIRDFFGNIFGPRDANAAPNQGLTDQEIANIIFNETRSFSGPDIDKARRNIAHAIINGERLRGSKRPKTAPTTANVPPAEAGTYQDILENVRAARLEREWGDPTKGAIHFNFRNTSSRSPFLNRYENSTSCGPLNNSYPQGGLNATGVYANTYLP
jgi:RHS repeat-associated protein